MCRGLWGLNHEVTLTIQVSYRLTVDVDMLDIEQAGEMMEWCE